MHKLALLLSLIASFTAYPATAMSVIANDHDRIAAELGGNCTAGDSCEGVLYVSCQPELDGPSYYVDLTTEEVISACGGTCRGPRAQERCQKQCPPPQWSCTR